MYDDVGFGTVSHEPIDQSPLNPVSVSNVEPVELPEENETIEPAQAAPAPAPEQPAPRKKPTQELQDRNFYELRKREELRERELELMRREIEQLRAQNTNKPTRSSYEELGIEKDALAEVHQVEKIVQRALAQQEERYRKQLEEQKQLNAERLIQREYKDIYQVLTPENLRRLEEEEPEIAASIAANPDVYSAKIAAYKQIKRLGIEQQTYNEYRVQERLAQNAQRPKSPAAVMPRQGSPALQAATGPAGREVLTEEMQARYRKEMEDAIRGF